MKKKLKISSVEALEPEIGRWLGALQDCRRRTKQTIEGISQAQIDWADGGNSIGTLLYHISAIELDWLYADVLQADTFPEDIAEIFSIDVRDGKGNLSPVTGEDLNSHLSRMDITREQLLNVYKKMTIEDYRRLRMMGGYEVTPEWVLHHLMQHEAEHRGQIEILLGLMEKPPE